MYELMQANLYNIAEGNKSRLDGETYHVPNWFFHRIRIFNAVILTKNFDKIMLRSFWMLRKLKCCLRKKDWRGWNKC